MLYFAHNYKRCDIMYENILREFLSHNSASGFRTLKPKDL